MTRSCHFLTFGGGPKFPSAAARLAEQARNTGLFATVQCESGDEIFARWPEFEVHRPFIETNPKGWGYWLWKPFLIGKHLQGLPESDALFYMDAGCEITPGSTFQLGEVLGNLYETDHLLWDYSEYPIFNVQFWTKQSLLNRVAEEYSLRELVQIPKIWAGNVGFAKTKKNLSLVEDWYRLAAANNYCFLDDSPSSCPQAQLFIEHRHDQSILSLLVAAYGIESTGSAFDFCFGEPHLKRWPELLNRPFLAMRNDGKISQIESFLEFLSSECGETRRAPQQAASGASNQKAKGWSHETAEKLTKDHRAVLRSLGLL